MYDFNNIENRRHTNSMKWDVNENELPMWVADMDFRTAPAVIEALENRVRSGIYGYSVVPETWKSAIANWWYKRHGILFKHEWIIFCTGVVPAISSIVERVTNIGDNVVILTPAYDIFYHSVENHGRHVLESKMNYLDNRYTIDYEDLEQKLAHPNTTMMILCNPHNPIGKIWSKQELAALGKLCDKHHVVLLSDEIHCDLTDPGMNYTPFAAASEVCAQCSITCVSASKAFNLAGLQGATVIVPSEGIRQKVERGLNSDEIAEPNAFVIDAMVAAFTEGERWLESLRSYIYENKQTVSNFLKREIPLISLVKSDATYLLWIDCEKLCTDTKELCEFIRKETGLYLADGSKYRGNGKQFLRMNIACPLSVVEDGLNRLKKSIDAYKNRAD